MGKDFKEMRNSVMLQGTLVDSTVENKVDRNGKKYLSGVLEIMVDHDYIIPVTVFSYELKNSGEKNQIYERLVKLIDLPTVRAAGSHKAAKISVSNGRIEGNNFVSERENKVIANWRLTGVFIKAAASDAGNQNSFEVQGVVSSIKEVIDREGNPTDTYDLKLLNVGYGNKVNELVFRFDDPAAAKYINENYHPGDYVTLCGEVVYQQLKRVVEKEFVFGEPVKQTQTSTVRLLRITAGTPATDGEAAGYPLKDLQNLANAQNSELQEKFNARAQVQAAANKAAGANLLF